MPPNGERPKSLGAVLDAISYQIGVLMTFWKTTFYGIDVGHIAFACHLVLGVIVTLHVLRYKRDISSAIGWIGVAWLSPILGAALYFVFGVNRITRRAKRLLSAFHKTHLSKTEETQLEGHYDGLKQAIGRITGLDLSTAATIAPLRSGDQSYPAMLADIEKATKAVLLSSYIFRDDAVGRDFIDALARAQQKGLLVRVLIDGIGGGFLRSAAYWHLREKHIPVARFLHSLVPWKMPFLNLRLHKKSLIIDGRVAYLGGLNIGSENIKGSDRSRLVRDTHFRIEGPVVEQIWHDFAADWQFANNEILPHPPAQESADHAAGRSARIIAVGPDQEADQLVYVLLSAISCARHSIRIMTPYFLPDESIITALQIAALKGVDVHIIFPATNNKLLVGWAMNAHIGPLLMSGCRLSHSAPPFDHSKWMTIDEEWVLIGSPNWDIRSLRLNFEIAMEAYDTGLAKHLNASLFHTGLHPIHRKEWESRSVFGCYRDAIARLLMPYL